jgi:glyoxylase-like metal-dependent hydrolase (beta-lactamase superfamily II)
MPNLVTITLNSTHYYLIDCLNGKLLVDTGWAGSLPRFTNELKRYKISLAEIRYMMITHHHPDHAGLTQEIKNACGARLLIHEKQIPFLPDLAAFYRDKGGYVPIQVEKDDLVLHSANREVLKSIGLAGEVIPTPGHSEDSVSLVLDGSMAFTGDLTPPFMADETNAAVLRDSWTRILARKPKTIYPAHANPFPASQISGMVEDIK